MPKSAERAWPAELLGQMEHSFQRPLRNVRVFEHSWPEKHGADALATDSKLVFKPGLFPPRDAASMELLGHEVAHAMQGSYVPEQSGTRPLVHANAALEAEAGRAGARAAQGMPVDGLSSINAASLPSGTYPVQLGKKGSGNQEQGKQATVKPKTRQQIEQDNADLFLEKNRDWRLDAENSVLVRAEGSSEAAAAPGPIVRDRRSYQEDREAQALRWTSSVLLEDLNRKKTRPVEVQTNWLNDQFTVAANMNKANQELLNLAGGNAETAKDVLKGASQRLHGHEPEKLPPRVKRHLQKLDQRLVGENISPGYQRLATALNSPFDIAAEQERLSRKEDEGLHAERRIKSKLGEEFGHGVTKGTKRPCAACHTALYSDTEAHAGPLWTSGYATQGYNDLSAFANAPYTSATKIKSDTGRDYTFDYDTDSDSELEDEE